MAGMAARTCGMCVLSYQEVNSASLASSTGFDQARKSAFAICYPSRMNHIDGLENFDRNVNANGTDGARSTSAGRPPVPAVDAYGSDGAAGGDTHALGVRLRSSHPFLPAGDTC